LKRVSGHAARSMAASRLRALLWIATAMFVVAAVAMVWRLGPSSWQAVATWIWLGVSLVVVAVWSGDDSDIDGPRRLRGFRRPPVVFEMFVCYSDSRTPTWLALAGWTLLLPAEAVLSFAVVLAVRAMSNPMPGDWE